MSVPVIGIIGNCYLINDQYPVRGGSQFDCVAIREFCGAVPMIIPSDPRYITPEEVCQICDGVIFTGGRPNVHPNAYGEEVTEAHGAFDPERDALTLPLIRLMVERAQPFLAVCRGFQELAVAYGCKLHPEIRDLPGRMNHRMPPDGTLEEKFALRHEVRFTKGGRFHRLLGQEAVQTNTLHGQGIIELSEDIIADGHAPDGTVEAIYPRAATGFAYGVQWHPEGSLPDDPTSQKIYHSFGEAVRHWRTARLAA